MKKIAYAFTLMLGLFAATTVLALPALGSGGRIALNDAVAQPGSEAVIKLDSLLPRFKYTVSCTLTDQMKVSPVIEVSFLQRVAMGTNGIVLFLNHIFIGDANNGQMQLTTPQSTLEAQHVTDGAGDLHIQNSDFDGSVVITKCSATPEKNH